jgi:Sulfotransferase domain
LTLTAGSPRPIRRVPQKRWPDIVPPASSTFVQGSVVGTSNSGSPAPQETTPSNVPAPRVRVLYIGGTGRTGSTLLTNLLGEFPGFFAAGELAFIWRFGFLNDGRCGCGLVLRDCPVWQSIFAAAYGGAGNVDAAELVRLRRRFNSNHLPLMLTRNMRERLLERSGDFPQTVEKLYHGIAEATGSRVIIDSSKEPHYSYILRSLPSLEVFFLHLVRDPRGVAFSWKDHRKKESGLSHEAMMEERGSIVSSTYFDVSNIAAELLWARTPDHYMFLRYEDFLSRPEQTIRSIGEFVGEDIDPQRVLRDGQVILGQSHTAWGNPNRFDQGPVRLKTDETWRSAMPRQRQLAVTGLTLPLMKHYRYSLRPTL